MPVLAVPNPSDEDKAYMTQFKNSKKLRALINEAKMTVNARGPVSADYAPIMRLMDQVELMAVERILKPFFRN